MIKDKFDNVCGLNDKVFYETLSTPGISLGTIKDIQLRTSHDFSGYKHDMCEIVDDNTGISFVSFTFNFERILPEEVDSRIVEAKIQGILNE